MPRIALEALPSVAHGYDAVVVDEAQDLEAEDWALVLALAGDGPLWVLGDEAQSLWGDARQIPDAVRGFVYTLKSRYRCPAELSTFADRYRPNGATLNPQPVDGLRVLEVAPDDVLSACEREVAALVRGGIRPEQIAVLSLAGQQRTTLGRLDALGDLVTVRADATDAARHVVLDTFLRFKGLERPWVVVTELGLGAHHYATRMHIALTRATVGCVLIATPAELAADPHLAAAR